MTEPKRSLDPPVDVTLRAMTAHDVPAALALCRASRWNQTAGEWHLFLALAAGGAIVAERAGQVIGTAVTLPYEDRFAWVSMVLVDPAQRGRGVGRALLTAAIDNAPQVDALRLDATSLGRPLYATLGFTEEYSLGRYERRTAIDVEAASSEAHTLTEADWDAVAALDRDGFGAGRLPVLQWCWRSAPEYAWTHRSPGGRLDGFVLGRHGHDFEQIGPLVAVDQTAAARLVASALAQVGERPVCIDVPDAHAGWREGLLAGGFVLQRSFTRMVRGALRHPGVPSHVFAIAGPEFG
jgi:GNAT superfamily N-acetyltransferase